MNSICKKRVVYRVVKFLVVGFVFSGAVSSLMAGTVNQVGTYANWPTTWVPLNALNDADDGLSAEQLDFVGNTTTPAVFCANNGEYVFFRTRVDMDTVISTTFRDAHFIVINLVGQDMSSTTHTLQAGTDELPDYAIVWDSKSNDNTKHGLEMTIRATTGSLWRDVTMDDIDLDAGKKGANDINGDGRTMDGYVRTIDQQSTTGFGMTTTIDYAVKWSYLHAYTGLNTNQIWNVNVASLANATDHNAFTADIGGGANPASSVSVGWVPLYNVLPFGFRPVVIRVK